MSLALRRPGTTPGVSVDTAECRPGGAYVVGLGQYELALEDFLDAAYHVLTNFDLAPGDPRLAFMGRLASLSPGRGWNPAGVRLRPDAHEEVVPRPCPSCGTVAVHPPGVRSGKRFDAELGREVGVVDIGWACRACGHEWGFEVLTEP